MSIHDEPPQYMEVGERMGRHPRGYYNSVDYEIMNPEEAHEMAYMARYIPHEYEDEEGMSEIQSPMLRVSTI